MKAAVLRETNRPMSIEDVILDPPKSDEVHVRIAAAGVCRSDLHFMKGEASLRLPAVLGHEGSAVVLDVGERVTSVAPGDHVILSFVPWCGRCRYCLAGLSNLCDLHGSTIGTMLDGTRRLHAGGEELSPMGKVACFAEEAVVPETGCVKIDPGFPMPQAALIGCSVTTGVGSVIFNARVEPGSAVAVIGCGGVGLNAIQGARAAGATTIIAVDVNDAALEFAGKFGASFCWPRPSSSRSSSSPSSCRSAPREARPQRTRPIATTTPITSAIRPYRSFVMMSPMPMPFQAEARMAPRMRNAITTPAAASAWSGGPAFRLVAWLTASPTA